MNTHKKQFTLVMLFTLCLLLGGVAKAEYRLVAFDEGSEYAAIISGNAEEAITAFNDRYVGRLNFMDLNNLCVSQIMVNDTGGAISSCEEALVKITRERSSPINQRRRAEAWIYSNLAVAKAKSGDFQSARSDLEVALNTYSRDENARINLEQLSVNLVARNQE